jgi:tetratricopeptide (TPR) repeat protein
VSARRAPGRVRRPAARAFVLAAALAAAPVLWPGGVARASLETGFTALAESDFAAAETAFLGVLAREPRNLEAMRLLGLAYLEEGRTREAFSTLQTLRVLAPDDARVQFALARVYYQAGLRPQERTALTEALRLDPKFTQAHRFLAHALVQEGELYSASAEYVWLKEEADNGGQPADPVVLFNLGLLDARLGRPDRAVDLLRRFLSAVPGGEQANQARAVLARAAASLNPAVPVPPAPPTPSPPPSP